MQMNVVTHQNTLATFKLSLGTMFMKSLVLIMPLSIVVTWVDPGTLLFDYLKSAADVNAWWCTLKQSCSKFVMEQKL
jgi:hypothetical protein